MAAAPVNIDDFERHAERHLPRMVWGYYSSGANDQRTLRENVTAFDRLYLRPRVLVPMADVRLNTTVLGIPVQSPVLVAPTAMQRMAHPDGEEGTARACAKANTIMCVSSWATTSLEDVAAAAPEGLRWFQLYVYKDRPLTASIVRRAEAAGYRALVLTVDAPLLGRREADVRNGFSLPPHLKLANFAENTDPLKRHMAIGSAGNSGLAAYVASQLDQSLSWKDVQWLRSLTKLPIIVKGIQTAEDALIAVANGVNAIWVSNHGARQLDGVAAAVDILPEVLAAVDGRLEVYVDGGIRRGTSVAKALALGARAVFIGRPILWGLAHSGEAGVSRVLELLNDEVKLAMTLLAAIRRDHKGRGALRETVYAKSEQAVAPSRTSNRPTSRRGPDQSFEKFGPGPKL